MKKYDSKKNCPKYRKDVRVKLCLPFSLTLLAENQVEILIFFGWVLK
jgi:hypothetical protein